MRNLRECHPNKEVECRITADNDGSRYPEQIRAEQKRHHHETCDHGQKADAVDRAHALGRADHDGEHEQRNHAPCHLDDNAVSRTASDDRERDEVLQIPESHHHEHDRTQQRH